MARRVRQWNPGQTRATTGREANARITDWLAQQSHQQKSASLRKQYKKAERQSKAATNFAGNQATFAKKEAKRIEAAGRSIEAQSAGLQGYADAYEAAQRRAAAQIEMDPKYQKMTGRKNKARRDAYVRQRMNDLPERAAYESAVAASNANQSAYRSRAAKYRKVQRKVEQANKRATKAHKRYVSAHSRYSSWNDYVPYSPA